MKITVFGGTGNVGSRIVEEAFRRGHQVTAVARDESRTGMLPAKIKFRKANIHDVSDVISVSESQDVIISAIRPQQGKEKELVSATNSTLAGLSGTGIRLLISGGAGSLMVPGTGGRLVVDDPKWVYPSFRDIALACVDQFYTVRGNTNVDWTYLCPAAELVPGERTGNYRLGKDELLINSNGDSKISMEDLAVALLDEVESPQHIKERFTVAY